MNSQVKADIDNLKTQVESLTALLESKSDADRRLKERVDELEATVAALKGSQAVPLRPDEDDNRLVQRADDEPRAGTFRRAVLLTQ